MENFRMITATLRRYVLEFVPNRFEQRLALVLTFHHPKRKLYSWLYLHCALSPIDFAACVVLVVAKIVRWSHHCNHSLAFVHRPCFVYSEPTFQLDAFWAQILFGIENERKSNQINTHIYVARVIRNCANRHVSLILIHCHFRVTIIKFITMLTSCVLWITIFNMLYTWTTFNIVQKQQTYPIYVTHIYVSSAPSTCFIISNLLTWFNGIFIQKLLQMWNQIALKYGPQYGKKYHKNT